MDSTVSPVLMLLLDSIIRPQEVAIQPPVVLERTVIRIVQLESIVRTVNSKIMKGRVNRVQLYLSGSILFRTVGWSMIVRTLHALLQILLTASSAMVNVPVLSVRVDFPCLTPKVESVS